MEKIMAVKILAFAGSARQESFNKKLVKIAVKGALKEGAEVNFIDLRDYPLPLMDQDLEAKEGLPENAKKLKEIFKSHDGFLISCPEYNSSITPLLKNVIDWVSRKEKPDEPSLVAFNGKTAALLSASPGALGGLRGLVHVRAILSNLGVLVLPTQIAVSKASEAFNEDGTLKDQKQQMSVDKLAKDLVVIISKLK
jgi:chromate reductase